MRGVTAHQESSPVESLHFRSSLVISSLSLVASHLESRVFRLGKIESHSYVTRVTSNV